MLRKLYRRIVPQAARDAVFLMRYRSSWMIRRRQRFGKAHDLPGELIISLTSHRPRFSTLALTLRQLIMQDCRPDRIILWIEEQDLPFLPSDVLALRAHGLSIEQCEKGFRCYNKIIPCLRKWPGAFIITVDDDIGYPADTVADLVTSYRNNDKEVLFRRGHRIVIGENLMPKSYNDWAWEAASELGELDNFPTGVGGVLYPPGVLHADATRSDLFLELCPTNDDVWLFFMASRNGCTFRKVRSSNAGFVWPNSQSVSLASHNFVAESGNDAQIATLVQHYGFPPR